MLPFLGKTISRILQLLGLGGLPDDLRSWGNLIRNHVLPLVGGLVSGGWLSFASEPTWWQVTLAVVGTIAGIYVIQLLVRHRLMRRQSYETLQEKPTAQENRSLLCEALTDRLVEGNTYLDDPDFYGAEVIEKWEKRTSKLITAALGQDEGMTFLINEDIPVKGWLTTPLERRVAHRMHRLNQVMDRVDSSEPLELRSDFDGREWVSKK